MVRHYFALNAAGLFGLLLIFAVQWPLQSQTTYFSVTGPGAGTMISHEETSHGLPPIVVLRRDYQSGIAKREVEIQWLNVALLLAIGYVFTMPVGRLVTGPVFPNQHQLVTRRPVLTLLLVLACVAVVAVAVTITLSVFYPNLADDADETAGHPWLVIFIGCFTIGAIPTLFITLLVMAIRRIREARQSRRTGFAVLPAASVDSASVP
jgi:hypothetical protein